MHNFGVMAQGLLNGESRFLSRMVKKLRLLKGGSVPTFVGLGPVLHNKLAVDA
jgi:hypothetical protein